MSQRVIKQLEEVFGRELVIEAIVRVLEKTVTLEMTVKAAAEHGNASAVATTVRTQRATKWANMSKDNRLNAIVRGNKEGKSVVTLSKELDCPVSSMYGFISKNKSNLKKTSLTR
jgi:hypothetical protein